MWRVRCLNFARALVLAAAAARRVLLVAPKVAAGMDHEVQGLVVVAYGDRVDDLLAQAQADRDRGREPLLRAALLERGDESICAKHTHPHVRVSAPRAEKPRAD